MTTTETAQTTQVYRVYIKASPEAIWDAITKPEWTERYGYAGAGRVRPAPRRRLPGPAGRGDGRLRRSSGRDRRRRGDRGRPAPQAGADVADAHGSRARRPRASPASRTRSSPSRAARRSSRSSTSWRARRGWPTSSPEASRARAQAAAGPGCSATSSRCWRPASRLPAEARNGRRPGCEPGLRLCLRRERRGWDSNPRGTGLAPSGFQDRRIRPLCHPSGESQS